MGFEGPKSIKDSVHNGNFEHLSAAGRKGAEKTNAGKKRERERAEISELQSELATVERELEDQKQLESANEHIITPDGEDLDYSKQ